MCSKFWSDMICNTFNCEFKNLRLLSLSQRLVARILQNCHFWIEIVKIGFKCWSDISPYVTSLVYVIPVTVKVWIQKLMSHSALNRDKLLKFCRKLTFGYYIWRSLFSQFLVTGHCFFILRLKKQFSKRKGDEMRDRSKVRNV